MAHYRVATEWLVDAPIDRVWDALLSYTDWPKWWRGFRTVEKLGDGDERGVGMRLRQGWRSWLPYTLKMDLEIVRVERPHVVEGRATGDVAGTCTWALAELDGGTQVRFVLDIRTTRRWMNVPVPFIGHVFASNFEMVMRWGAVGLAKLLGARVERRRLDGSPAGAAALPARADGVPTAV